jgi:hypothetical protein
MAGVHQSLRQVFAGPAIDIRNNDLRSSLGQRPAELGAEQAGAAGDDRYPPGQVKQIKHRTL